MMNTIRTGRERCSKSGRWGLAAAVACITTGLGFALGQSSQAQETSITSADGRPLVTIREVMEKTITPATNTIWNAYEPPSTDEEWLALEEAAITLLVAGNVVALGGTGPMDNEWVEQPAWKAFNQIMINAGQDALAAIRARDHDDRHLREGRRRV